MRHDLEDVLRSLLIKAKEDGIITSDEQNILDMVKNKLNKLSSDIEMALSDDVITVNERELIKESRVQLMSEVFELANSDKNLTNDELQLLNLLLDHLRNLKL
jgi:uncharacterized tellurite resistance protein B-like protein